MDPKNCVAFRTDKLGSQEPALDLYCSKNNLIRGQQLPPLFAYSDLLGFAKHSRDVYYRQGDRLDEVVVFKGED